MERALNRTDEILVDILKEVSNYPQFWNGLGKMESLVSYH